MVQRERCQAADQVSPALQPSEPGILLLNTLLKLRNVVGSSLFAPFYSGSVVYEINVRAGALRSFS